MRATDFTVSTAFIAFFANRKWRKFMDGLCCCSWQKVGTCRYDSGKKITA